MPCRYISDRGPVLFDAFQTTLQVGSKPGFQLFFQERVQAAIDDRPDGRVAIDLLREDNTTRAESTVIRDVFFNRREKSGSMLAVHDRVVTVQGLAPGIQIHGGPLGRRGLYTCDLSFEGQLERSAWPTISV